MKRRVVITGMGLVTPLGCNPGAVWQALATGRSAIRRLDPRDVPPGGCCVGAPVTDLTPLDLIDPKSRRLMLPAVMFGVAAAQLAAEDSAVRFDTLDPSRLGVFVGSRGQGSDRQDLMPAILRASTDGEFRLDTFGIDGLPLVHPMWLLKGLANIVLYFVSLKYGAQGTNINLSAGGVGATMAIGEAFRAVQRGYADVAFAGGYDSLLDVDRLELYAVSDLVTKATDAAGAGRPFDRLRDGFVPAEGAGFFILESLESATDRGAHIYAEVLGFSCETAPRDSSTLGPSARGFARALQAAIVEAGEPPDAVFAFGLGTEVSDREETEGLKTVFGRNAMFIPVPALKSMMGNTLAASGAIEAAAAVLALAHGAVPPTIHLTEPDTACDLDYVAGPSARSMPLHRVALNNANLAGAHAALVLGLVP